MSTIEFSTIHAPRTFEHVGAQIRDLLASGELKAGDKLPPERELCVKLRVSRGVLREALRALEYAGLIELRKGGAGGSFIARNNEKFVRNAYSDMVRVGSVSLDALTEARVLVMIDAIELGCARATEADYAELEANIEKTTEAIRLDVGYEKRVKLIIDFYSILARGSKNQVLMATVDAMTSSFYQLIQNLTPTPYPNMIEHRRRFMKHYRARDTAKATKELASHLNSVHAHILLNRQAGAANKKPGKASSAPVKKSRKAATAAA
ncbi:FadR/GntR family transcriptional regulator [Hydrogenophaga palleronii]|uniref:FadR/GntR family transcriptional regulator n=1 Tax=Hydrogenophaga palleronii TaxID=65655 RepID=UPI000824D275|nr:GntR family transcriptional regulator [Hydrogenophaga palleronii]